MLFTGLNLEQMVEKVRKLLPLGWELSICIESATAWITLHNPEGYRQKLPDATDKSIDEQIDEAIFIARRIHKHHFCERCGEMIECCDCDYEKECDICGGKHSNIACKLLDATD